MLRTATTTPAAGESGIKVPVILIVPEKEEEMEMSCTSCVPGKKLINVNILHALVRDTV
jgi:hypothetical protein